MDRQVNRHEINRFSQSSIFSSVFLHSDLSILDYSVPHHHSSFPSIMFPSIIPIPFSQPLSLYDSRTCFSQSILPYLLPSIILRLFPTFSILYACHSVPSVFHSFILSILLFSPSLCSTSPCSLIPFPSSSHSCSPHNFPSIILILCSLYPPSLCSIHHPLILFSLSIILDSVLSLNLFSILPHPVPSIIPYSIIFTLFSSLHHIIPHHPCSFSQSSLTLFSPSFLTIFSLFSLNLFSILLHSLPYIIPHSVLSIRLHFVLSILPRPPFLSPHPPSHSSLNHPSLYSHHPTFSILPHSVLSILPHFVSSFILSSLPCILETLFVLALKINNLEMSKKLQLYI